MFVTSPSFPAATLEGLVGPMAFETAPVLPVVTLDDAPRPGAQVGHVVLATTPSVPTATLDLGSGIPYLIGAMTLDTTSTLPAATFSTSDVGLIGAAELVTTPVLPSVVRAGERARPPDRTPCARDGPVLPRS